MNKKNLKKIKNTPSRAQKNWNTSIFGAFSRTTIFIKKVFLVLPQHVVALRIKGQRLLQASNTYVHRVVVDASHIRSKKNIKPVLKRRSRTVRRMPFVFQVPVPRITFEHRRIRLHIPKISPYQARRYRRQSQTWFREVGERVMNVYFAWRLGYQRSVVWPVRRLTSVGTSAVYVLLLVSVVISGSLPSQQAYAGTSGYDFSVPGNYTPSDATKVEIASSQARLINKQYTGAEANTSALWNFDTSSTPVASTSDLGANGNTLSYSTTSPCNAAGQTMVSGKVQNPSNTYGALSAVASPNCATVADSASTSINGVNPSITAEAYVKFGSAFSESASISAGILDKGNYKLYFDEVDGKLKFELEDSAEKTWTKVGGASNSGSGINLNEGLNGSWRQYTGSTVSTVIEYSGSIYAGLSGVSGGANMGTGEVWKYSGSGTTWTKVGGDGSGSSPGTWNSNAEFVNVLLEHGGNLYAGIGGTTAGEAEVWRYSGSGSTWTKVAGESLGFTANTIEEVVSMASDGTNIFVGLGSTANADAKVYRCANCNSGSSGFTWTLTGGDGSANNWASTASEQVMSLAVMDTTLFAGLGNNVTGEGDVWRWSGSATTWTKIAGDGTVFPATTYMTVPAMVADSTNDVLYVATGGTANTAGDLWRCTTTCMSGAGTWSQIGGDGTGWAATTYESVRSLAIDGTTVYVGLGDSAGDAEVYRCATCNATASYTRIGGDGTNGFSSWDAGYTNPAGTGNNKERVYGLRVGSTNNLLVGLGNSIQDSEVWTCSSCTGTPSWSWLGGRDWNSWGAAPLSEVLSMAVSDGKMYIGTGNTAAQKYATVWQYDGTTWTQIGGGTKNLSSGSWEQYETIRSMVSYAGDLYVGTGENLAGDGDIWKYNGTIWSQVGGDGTGLAATTYEVVVSMASDDLNLYVGMGVTAGATDDGDLWRYNGSTWVQIGGDAVGGWTGADNIERVTALTSYKTESGTLLFAGTGSTTADADVWRCTNCATAGSGFSWTKIGGDGGNSGWSAAVYETIRSLAFVGSTLYVGLGDTAGDGEVWGCANCTNTGATASWGGALIGGDGTGWNVGEIEMVNSLVGYNGMLYASLGNTNASGEADSELWMYDGANWTKVGGDALPNNTWPNLLYENVNTMAVYNGRLYVGLGSTVNAASASDAEVWEYGANTQKKIASATSSWGTDWTHVAATYNGTTAKIYVNGIEDASTTFSVTLADGSLPLTVGSLKSPMVSNMTSGGYVGLIDELRISSIDRAANTFVLNQYTNASQTVQPTGAISRTQKTSWSGFSTSETTNGGTITYRLSDDNGVSWKYWNGSNWVTSNSTAESNAQNVVHVNIGSFPMTTAGLLWQAVLTGNGDQRVILNSVTVSFVDDTQAPDNVASVTSLSGVGGSAITTNTWYNHDNPSFSWTAPADNADTGGGEVASGVGGYYVYFGTNSAAVPRTDGAFQTGTSYTASGLTSGQTYYLRIQTRDAALNVTDDLTGVLAAFIYKYDKTVPTAPGGISVSPSGFTASNAYTFIWPVSGGSAATDTGAPTTGSGVAGYQFKTGAATGTYSDWSSIILANVGEVSLPINPGDDDPAYQEGSNTFYLRAVDTAGNVSLNITATYYYAGSAPGAPLNLVVLPPSTADSPLVDNSFSFTWDEPAYFNGSIKSYHFSVNKFPTSTNTTTTPFRALAAAPYATQQGKNTFFIVAEDEAGNANYSIYASVDFYTQTPAPAAPTSLQIFDISNRDTQEYAISMKWTEPTKGNGFDGYEVYRSEDNETFTSAGTTKSPVFIDTNLTSKMYYYRVRSKDNAGQYSADSTHVSIVPTGRYTSAPKLLDGPEVTAKSFSAVLDWTTDRIGSSFVEIGSDADHLGKERGGDTIGTLDLVTSHTVEMKGLQPETTYAYRVVWVDQDGNRGQSDSLLFTTGIRPKISDVLVTNITLTGATLSWTSTTVSTSTINYGRTKAFGSSLSDTSGGGTTKHTVRLEDLDDTSTYYFVITGKDLEDNTLSSDEYSFVTLTRPILSNFKMEPVKDAPTTSIRFSWTTNVATTSVVTYSRAGAGARSSSAAEYATSHEMVVQNLSDLTVYTVQARGVDKFGNTASSDSATITTPDDSRAPRIINMTVEVRSTGVGTVQKAQLVVNWETDEPGTSQVEYGPGISSESYSSRTQEDPALSTTHVVIVPELEPAKLYHLRAVSRDRAGNAGTSDDTTSITGKAQRSVVDIIVSSLQRSLGFLSVIPGLSGN